jgi:hypothetical protein
MIRTYSDLRRLSTFEERYQYLRLIGTVGEQTFGFNRYLNQTLYSSQRWRKARDEVIIRDKGCDLGIEGYEIGSKIIIHHMNPITIKDIELGREEVFNPEYLICTSLNTHNAIHFGDETKLPQLPIERHPGDTCPWRR